MLSEFSKYWIFAERLFGCDLDMDCVKTNFDF